MACCDVDNLRPVPLGGCAPAPEACGDASPEWCHEGELEALVKGADVEVVDTNLGTSGVFFLCQSGAPAGVFKPASQEHVPDEFKGALIEGENLYRERAAYVVSQRLGGLCGVPATVIATVEDDKLGGTQEGSLQRFVPHAVDMSDMGPGGLSDDEVHKVGMLDLLLLNLDRHEGNMLLKEEDDGSRVLIPIDHGLCLPRLVTPAEPPATALLHQLSFVWQGWKHACRPFSAGARALAASLSPRVAASLADTIKADMPTMPQHALTTLKIGALTLRVCVGAGMTLREVAEFVLGGLGDALTAAWGEGATSGDYASWEAKFMAKLEAAVRKVVLGEEEEEVAFEEAPAALVSPAASIATCVANWTLMDSAWGSSASSLASLELSETAKLTLGVGAAEAGAASPCAALLRRRVVTHACDDCRRDRNQHHHVASRERSRSSAAARASRRRRARRGGGGAAGGGGGCSSVSSCPSSGPSPTAGGLLRVASSGGLCRLGSAGPSPGAALRRGGDHAGAARRPGGTPLEALQNVWRMAGMVMESPHLLPAQEV